ncbi:MAG: 50S ribosomal protein L15 [Candidatus Pacebacteria bacterium]|nr:50S ribosomal protein L15 [Candidatus Paceibacterota bacterium]
MELHNLKRATPRKHHREIGRGGKRGKTSGRGTKGQKSRAGHRMRPELRDIIKKIPKKRGYGKNRAASTFPRPRPFGVNVSALSVFPAGATVNPKLILEYGIVRSAAALKGGIKILGNGSIDKKVTVTGCTVSEAAKTKIEAAGGSVA